jgi:prefoldin alpha subunit
MSAARPPPTDQELQEDLVRLDAYRSQLNTLAQQHQILVASRQDHARARESLEGVDRADASSEFLLPFGGETYVRGSIARGEPVLIGIGSGVVVEMDRAEVVELLAKRLERIDEAVRDLEGQIGSIEERAELLSRRLEAASRSAGASGDVGGA